MNRFRTKKKGRDEDGVPRPSQDSESSMPFRGFRKGKRSQDNEKKQIDLTSALPSNDDFRTSLLMTGLSARFSMLREQDDPNTKIGKASDDSVLFPKRQSRMDLASFRGLGDIAEVESIKASSPFARMDSYHSDDADSLNSGSIMSRAKPTEGNNLFGGRQKIYKIPAGAGSSRGVDGGMAGRALYDDDVAHSAFQKWRRAEKEREREQEEQDGSDVNDDQSKFSADLDPRSESPTFSNYNGKRETSSTLSSIPSVARYSSTATSITSSQPTPSLKESISSSGFASGPERSVTRTRRLYETGFFNQDPQDSAVGGLSRMDTLSRQRPFGTRTPDSNQQLPSLGFPDRLSDERRLLAKGSAPNLRSMSPPASASPTGAPQLGIRVPSAGESRANLIGTPPLSPPVSETDENSVLSINPNDRGKATALGVFQKPAQPYDESRYAQRQLQLQRGRDTPTQRTRDEPNPAVSGSGSRSPSPARKVAIDSPTVPLSAVVPLPATEEAQPTSFLADPDGSETSSVMASPKPVPSPQIHLRRPSDRQHPAFRDSAVPTPLALTVKSPYEPSSATEASPSLAASAKEVSPEDSPTLGPVAASSGLSGMVRQHLRADSNASSIYEAVQDYGTGSNPWESEAHGRDWNLDLDVNEPLPDTQSIVSDSSRPIEANIDPSMASNERTDEFASQLADGARRIREKLTSYVETDSRSSSPHRMTEQDDRVDLAPLPRPSGLGAILRPKSSRGSLIDRGSDQSSTRALKAMGISPGGSRTASPGSELHLGQPETDGRLGQERGRKEISQGDDDQHPGLRQFRQARRELQRLKEIESQSRHCPAPQGPPPDIPSPQHRSTSSPGGPRARAPSRDQKSPPVYHQQRIPGEGLRYGDFALSSQVGPQDDRQRSDSASSQGGRNNRGMRAGDEFSGIDINRSHVMPAHSHPNPSLMISHSAFDSNGKLHVPRGHVSGQPSPISPGPSPFVNSAPPTPATLSPPRPLVAPTHSYDNSTGHISNPHEAMRRKVNPRGLFSEPAAAGLPSRAATVPSLPEVEGNRSRSNSRAAPPLPPINPRRRQDGSKVRTVLESFARQGRDNVERNTTTGMPKLPISHSAYDLDRRGFATTEDWKDTGSSFGRPQRSATDLASMNTSFNKPQSNNHTNGGPLASRMMTSSGRNPSGGPGLPGGMI